MRSKVKFGRLSQATRWTVLACLLLMALTVATQALHSHTNELSSNVRHCTICQVAHAPSSVGPVVQPVPGPAATSYLSFSADPDSKQGLDAFSLFCRPPPLV